MRAACTHVGPRQKPRHGSADRDGEHDRADRVDQRVDERLPEQVRRDQRRECARQIVERWTADRCACLARFAELNKHRIGEHREHRHDDQVEKHQRGDDADDRRRFAQRQPQLVAEALPA
jgi:hypothetical protein